MHLYGTESTKFCLLPFACSHSWQGNVLLNFLFSRNQSDHGFNLQPKFTSHVPIRANKIKTEKKVPDAFLSNMVEVRHFSDDLLNVVNEKINNL